MFELVSPDLSFGDEDGERFSSEVPEYVAAASQERDRPLTLRWRFDRFGLHINSAERFDDTKLSIASEAALNTTAFPNIQTSYSRNRNHYRGRQTVFGDGYSYRRVTRAVDELAADGWIRNFRAPVWRRGWQSTLVASPSLLGLVRFSGSEAWQYRCSTATIRLKDRHGNPITFDWNDDLHQMERDALAINEMLATLKLVVPGLAPIPGTPLFRANGGVVNVRARQVYRVFNRGDFAYGGRFYGHFVQQLPSKLREELLIDGRHVAEPDFKCLHPRLVYAMAGKRLDTDAYEQGVYPRQEMKVAVQILLNSKSKADAVSAMSRKLAGDGADYTQAAPFRDRARRLIEAAVAMHSDISRYFASEVGLRCMRLDSDLANSVILRLMAQGIATIGVHDSFICADEHRVAVDSVMQEELEKLLNRIRREGG